MDETSRKQQLLAGLPLDVLKALKDGSHNATPQTNAVAMAHMAVKLDKQTTLIADLAKAMDLMADLIKPLLDKPYSSQSGAKRVKRAS